MIRIPTRSDKSQMMNLFSAVNLFNPEEIEYMSELVDNYFNESLGEGHCWIICEDQNTIVGVAYYASEAFGQEVYNFIGIKPSEQGKGIGSLMLKYVENHLQELAQRLLLVETSSLESFAKTRNFYTKNNFEKEATIREYYKERKNKIIFRKKLG